MKAKSKRINRKLKNSNGIKNGTINTQKYKKHELVAPFNEELLKEVTECGICVCSDTVGNIHTELYMYNDVMYEVILKGNHTCVKFGLYQD